MTTYLLSLALMTLLAIVAACWILYEFKGNKE